MLGEESIAYSRSCAQLDVIRVSEVTLHGCIGRLGCIDAMLLLAITGRNHSCSGRCGTLLQIGLLLGLQFVSHGGRGLLRLLCGIDMLFAIVLAIEFVVVQIGMDLRLGIGTDVCIEGGACKNNNNKNNNISDE